MSEQQKPILISVVGPTAVGKTSIAIQLARKYEAEILSCDARQFYRELEIGTAKPTISELQSVPHHFINNLSIQDQYSAGKFETDALNFLEKYFKNHPIAIMVGGSGLYSQSVWYGMNDMPAIKEGIRHQLNQEFEQQGITSLQEELKKADPTYYQEVDLNNHIRLIRALEVIRSTGHPFSDFRKMKNEVKRSFSLLNIGLHMERDNLNARIDDRMDQMIESGLFEEAEKFYPQKHLQALQTVGYQEIYGFMDGKYDKKEAIRLLKRNSRRYAKRQMTWFNRDDSIEWFNIEEFNQSLTEINQFIMDKLRLNA